MKEKFLIFGMVLWLGISALGGARAVAATDQELEATIQEVIRQRHPTDTPDWWRGLGANAPKVIVQLYEKTSAIYQRLRLVEALGWYDDPAAVEFLKKQALNTNDDVIRNGSVRAIGYSQGPKEIDFIAKFLDHEDPQTRMAAGQALKRMRDARADSILQHFYEKEPQPWVRDQVKSTPAEGPLTHPPRLKLDTKAEHVLKPEFAGSWKGFWVGPAGGDSSLMRSEAVQARTKIENSNQLEGELTILIPAQAQSGAAEKKERSLIVRFRKAKGKQAHLSGWLTGEGLKEFSTKAEVRFEGDLLNQGKVTVLRIQVPELLTSLVLRRQGGL